MLNLIRLTLALCVFLNVSSGFTADLKTIEEKLSDSMITTKLTAKFTKNTRLNPLKISVTTTHGRVTLKGNVQNKEAYAEAIRLTKTTKGVQSVDTKNLHIKPVNTIFTDTYITAKVEASLLRAKIFADESIPLVGINASTTNGIVILSGEVKRKESIDIILRYVKAVQGVKRVAYDKLRVGNQTG